MSGPRNPPRRAFRRRLLTTPASRGYAARAMPDLPTGTVTFLFTDVEGSTRLAEQHAEAMRAAQVRHDALVRDAIAEHHGHVFRPTGDGVCAVFATAPDAVAAAVA